MKNTELDASQARFRYDEELVSRLRRSCRKVGIIGQPRAMKALEMGMNVNKRGYNIYISGEDGTGRHTAVREIAQEIRSSRPVYDLAYACNFRRPQSPFLIVLPSPFGTAFRNGMSRTAAFVAEENWKEALESVRSLKKEIPGAPLLEQYLMQVSEALENRTGDSDRYLVNLICDNSGEKGCPLVEEYHPTHANLFGQLTGKGHVHLGLSAGSLLDAAGGFFVVRADKILSQE